MVVRWCAGVGELPRAGGLRWVCLTSDPLFPLCRARCLLHFLILSMPCCHARSSGPLETRALAEALQSGDVAQISETVAQAVALLGDRAGEPEVRDAYRPVPPEARVLSRKEARLAMLPHYPRLEKARFWRVGLDPSRLTAPLRAPASILACLTAARRAGLAGAEDAMPLATEAAEFLVWAQVQAGAGCFPFPAARHTSDDRAMQVASRFMEKAEAEGRLGAIVRQGWVFEDHGDGGLQFDNGECGLALLEYYELTHEPRWLESGLKAADWAAARPLCPNWNYNSFSVALLAKAYALTQRQHYLDAAVQKARLGVIPGQLRTGPRAGRWADPHNARPAYHYIMLSALARLAAVMPVQDVQRQEVLDALQLGLRARNAEFATQGVMNKDKAMECLLLVEQLFAHDGAFLEQTHTRPALESLTRLVSHEARQGRHPLGPRGWGEFLAWAAR